MTFWRFALVALVAFIASPGSSEPVSEIHRLKAQMDGNADRADLKRFWSRIARQGTPLIEPSHSEKGKMIVTFLWRGTGAEDRSPVAVFGPFNSVPWQRGDLLQNLPGTDVWYRSYHLDDRIAAPYLLLTEDAARHGRDIERLHAPDDDKGGSKPLQLFLDPYSRKTIENVYWGPLTRENYFAGFRSVLGTSGMARARDPGQTMAEYDLKSLALQNSRRVWIYAPEVARQAKKPALLIVFDGRSYIHAAQMPAMLDQLMTAGRI
jgi:enterochelin esterase family protein